MQIVDKLPPWQAAQSTADPQKVAQILADVRARGDAAVHDWTRELDGVDAPQLTVPPAIMQQAWQSVPAADQRALEHAARNIRAFADAQLQRMQAFELEIEPGFFVGQRLQPIEKVACYVPGGRYPLPSTVLMTALVAIASGVEDVVILTPPDRTNPQNAWPNRYILAAAHLAGVRAVYVVGGVQAVAAAAYGTETIDKVDLIVGPGNAWVTEAKRQVYGAVGIDALAGPSEVMILCDASSDVRRVAADLLAQAEHDPDAIAIAVTDDAAFAAALAAEVATQLPELSTKNVATASIASHGRIAVVADRAAMVALANERAPEHLEIHTADSAALAAQCQHFGGLFVGGDAAEVFGDYCAGPSHVLPTGRAGRYTGGLGAQTFVRILTTQRADPQSSAALAATAAQLARIEGLSGHAFAAELRKT